MTAISFSKSYYTLKRSPAGLDQSISENRIKIN